MAAGRNISFRVGTEIWDAYTDAAELLGMDRSTLIKQVLEQGVPPLNALIQSLRAVQAGKPVEGLEQWRHLIGSMVGQTRVMAADVVAVEAEMIAAADAAARGTGSPGPTGGSAPLGGD